VGSHEGDKLRQGDASVSAAGDAVSAQPAAVEPLADGPRGDVADSGDVAGGEHGFAVCDRSLVCMSLWCHGYGDFIVLLRRAFSSARIKNESRRAFTAGRQPL